MRRVFIGNAYLLYMYEVNVHIVTYLKNIYQDAKIMQTETQQ